MELFVQLLALSFQLGGAILLIVRYWTVSLRKQLQKKKAMDVHVEQTAIVCPTQSDEDYCRHIWMNRISFVYIAVGYMLSVFGDIENDCPCLTLLLVIVIAAFLMLIGYLAANQLAYNALKKINTQAAK